MRAFAIYSKRVRKKRACAWLLYDAFGDSYRIEIADWAGEDDLPWMLAVCAQHGSRSVEGDLARQWALSRIPPENRDNVGETMRAARTEEYYVPTLLNVTGGTYSGDDFGMVEVSARDYRNAAIQEEPEMVVALGAEFAKARRAKGLSQQDLSAATGIQQSVISKFERGIGNPTLDTVESLARGLGKTVRIALE